MVTLDEVMIIMKKVLAEIAYLPERIRIASNQIVVTSLSEISETLGLVKAGEFRSGNNKEPGTGFSGLRIMYPPFRHEDKEWNLAGFENDVLKVGVSASDGSLYGIEGRWWLNEREMGMLHTEEARAPLINWRTSDGSTAGNIRSVETANENNVTIASWGTPTSGRIRSRVVLYAANAGEISNLIVDNTGELIFNSIPARFYAGKPGIMTFTTAQADFAVGNGGMNFTSSEPNFLLDGGPQRMYFFGPQVSFLVEGPGKMSFVSPQANLLVESPGRMHFFGDQTEMRWEQEGVYQDGFRLDVIPAEGVLSTSTSDPFPPATTNVSVVQFVEFGRRSVGIWDGTRWRPNSFSNGIFDRANLQRSLTNCSFTAGSAVVSFSVADDSLHLASRMEWFGGAEFAAGAKIISVSYANNTVTMDSNSTLTGVATGSWRVPANTHLDAFAIRRPGTSSAAVIEMCLWNGTTRVEPLAFRDGILVKSTDNTRTYLGTIRTTTAGRTDTEFIYNQTFPYKNLATFIPNVPADGGSSNISGWTDDGTIVRLTTSNDRVGIGKLNPGGPLAIMDLPIFATHAAAVTGGLTAGDMYRTGTDHTTIASVMNGISWTTRTSVADNEWRSVTFGNNLFVAVATSGTGNRVMTSPDGITWTIRTSAADNDWWSVTFGNNLFVAVATTGSGNRVMTSPDGITWTIRTSAADNGWFGITFGNNLFVAVANTGTGNRVMTSPDGITWTIRTSAADNGWRAVTFGNNLFVAVSITGTGNRVMTSPDGITWTIRTSVADNNWHSITFGNNLFVAVSVTGAGNRVMTSPDGITWTIRTSAADNDWRAVTFTNGLFVAVASTGTGTRVMTSPNGITWTTRTSSTDNEWRAAAFGNGRIVATAATGTNNRVMTS